MQKYGFAALALAFASFTTVATAQFPTPSGGVVLPAYEAFDYTDSSALTAASGWYVRDGADPATVVAGSLVPSNATVAANLEVGAGNKVHVITTTEGSTAGWFIGGGANSDSGTGVLGTVDTLYYSFLIQFDTDGGRNGIPFNGPIVSMRSFDNGNSVKFALRGDNGAGGGGTNDGTDSALLIRADSVDVRGSSELDKNDTTYFVVAKLQGDATFNSSNSITGTMTVYLDPDPSAAEGAAAVYATSTEAATDYRFIRWFALDTDNNNADYFIDEIRIGTTWEDVTPTAASSVENWLMLD